MSRNFSPLLLAHKAADAGRSQSRFFQRLGGQRSRKTHTDTHTHKNNQKNQRIFSGGVIMSTNGDSNRPEAETTAALRASPTDHNNTRGPFLGTWGGGGQGSRSEKNATPLLHAQLLPGQDMLGISRSSQGSAPSSSAQLRPGAAAAAAAASAAATIRSTAAAHAAFSAFAAQAARNSHAGHAAFLFRESQASAAAAALLAQSSAPKRQHYGRGDPPEATGADLGMSTPGSSHSSSSSSSNGKGSRSSNASSRTRGAEGSGGGGHHAGAAYCLIPQPAYGHGHRDRQQPPPPPPPPPPRLSRTRSYSGGPPGNGRAGEAFGIPRLPGGDGTRHAKEYEQARRVAGGAAAEAAAMVHTPSVTGATADAQPYHGRRASSSSSLTSGRHRTSRIEPRRRDGLIDAAAFRMGGDSGAEGRHDLVLSARVRLERNREQNRQSSKKARVRRKGEEETLKEQIRSIQVCVCVCVFVCVSIRSREKGVS